MTSQRVTVTLPPDVVREIDRRDRNRSKFVLHAVRRELDRRRRAALRSSLAKPHSESDSLAELGLDEWAEHLPEGDQDLLDPEAGTKIRWTPGEGWAEVEG
ncbi:MAG: hypothetical protein ACREK5_09745 [Gemmatimonadota bacterium]